MNKELRNIAGTFLIDATAAFLNGAGLASGENKNVVLPKTFWEQVGARKEEVPYVSAQSWRRWLRNTANEENDWPPSELRSIKKSEKESTSKIATELNPITFPEDDIFGYMRSGSNSEESVQRTTAIKTSILKGIRGKRTINTDEGFVHLKEGTPLPYTTKFYSSHLEGFFVLEYYRLGLYDNLSSRVELASEILKEHRSELEETELDKKFKRYTLKDASKVRKERAAGLLKAVAHLRGGAKQAAFSADVSPKVLILSGLTTANPIFNDLFEAEGAKPHLKLETLQQIVSDYQDRIITPVYIGVRRGYLANEAEILNLSQQKNSIFYFDSPIGVVNHFIEDHLKVE